ncbi:MAG: excinuclease ABC subunit UvrA [Endomicrobiales bacterium]|jgi:excinuclease ABC subunit A
MDHIVIRGARQHNLKNISCEIPRNKLVVITGLSGSGKSSLAFDTIYAEGQRRYVESLSAYARQFLELMDKPDVDIIEGLSPAIAIEQRAPSHNPRSTVGTVTEIYDYLRLLFARIGVPYCPDCGEEIKPQSAQQIIDDISALPSGTRVQVLAPLVRGRIGTYEELFTHLKKSGYVRARVDGKVFELDDPIKLDRYKKHTIELVVDRLVIQPGVRTRLADSVETALKQSKGLALIIADGTAPFKEKLFSEHHACAACGISLPDIEPRLFSFNSPYGACPDCTGLGNKIEIDEDLVVPDKARSIDEGALVAWSQPITTRTHRWKNSWSGYYDEMLDDVCKRNGISRTKPWSQLSRKQQEILLSGEGDFEGVMTNLQRRYNETESEYVKEEIYSSYMRLRLCPTCKGARLKKEALAVKIDKKSIVELTRMSVIDSCAFFAQLPLSDKNKVISKAVLKEINARLTFLVNVGLGYLTLDRESATLAGGESQRIHLATQIGSGLTGVLYVLDEPSIGLHQRDNKKLLDTLIKLRDLGNTLIVVEHDEETMRASDWIIDLGPGAGVHGGEIVAQGPLSRVLKEKRSMTAQYLNGKLTIPVPVTRRKPREDRWLSIKGAAQFNLKNIEVNIPLGLCVCITGVSGSGKSTLVHEVLFKALAQKLYGLKDVPGKHRSMSGGENLDKVIIVDQSPIGRTPRSNPSTYTGAFGPIREIFSQMPESKSRGYLPGRFSFNVKGGRCENCQGDGTLKIEMQFLPDVYVHCEVCGGKRFNEETLRIRYKGKNIDEVLNMTVEEGGEFFSNIPHIARVMGTLNDVGLGYIKLGQPATTLSGGEAQRVKLATELSKRSTGRTLYILDEPTTGLHFADVQKLLGILHRLTDAGNTVLVIEHNLDVIKTSDWIIDLGPEGGAAGGRIVAQGTPEHVARSSQSYTGHYLSPLLKI